MKSKATVVDAHHFRLNSVREGGGASGRAPGDGHRAVVDCGAAGVVFVEVVVEEKGEVKWG